MRLYCVRHGQSVNNEEIMQGPDNPLSDLGLEQAQILAKRFTSIPIDLIIASPMLRAKQTAEIINGVLRTEIHFTDLVRERDWPSIMHGKRHAEPSVIELRALLREKNRMDPAWHHSDEENFADNRKRASKLKEYIEKVKQEKVLVVSHSGILKMFTSVMMLGPKVTYDEFAHLFHFMHMSNTSITVFERDSERKWSLLVWNDHMHLGLY